MESQWKKPGDRSDFGDWRFSLVCKGFMIPVSFQSWLNLDVVAVCQSVIRTTSFILKQVKKWGQSNVTSSSAECRYAAKGLCLHAVVIITNFPTLTELTHVHFWLDWFLVLDNNIVHLFRKRVLLAFV